MLNGKANWPILFGFGIALLLFDCAQAQRYVRPVPAPEIEDRQYWEQDYYRYREPMHEHHPVPLGIRGRAPVDPTLDRYESDLMRRSYDRRERRRARTGARLRQLDAELSNQ